MRRSSVLFAAFGVAAAGLGLAWTWPWLVGRAAGDGAAIARGETLYAERCATCHGARLEGQPDWKSPLPSGRLPAPPHDSSGHTWHHPDGVLFRVTKEGAAAVVSGGYESDMPGFGAILGDKDIRAILAFIKSTWPERERAYQAEMSRREREKTQCEQT
jgi:mono/diheme cytochrome c family protein